MLVEINISTSEEIINIISITNENMVCLIISSFTFSLLLSFTIDLYNLNLLTAQAKSAGINIIFCKSNDIKVNNIPFESPIIVIQTDIV